MIGDLLIPYRHGVLFTGLDHVKNRHGVFDHQTTHGLWYTATPQMGSLFEVGQTVFGSVLGRFDDQDILDTHDLRSQNALEVFSVHGLLLAQSTLSV